MTEIYSILKRLLPDPVRNFLRDSDRAYQDRLQEIDSKNRQIAELESSHQEILKELDTTKILLEQHYQKIDFKNRQIAELESSHQEILKELDTTKILLEQHYQKIDFKNRQIAELESSHQEILKELDTTKILLEQQHQVVHRLVENSDLSDEDYEQLSKGGLFIVGCARSGTSILCDCLNLSPDVFLLGEANLSLNYKLENFVEFFNTQHLQFKNVRSKGTFIPPSRLPEKGGLGFLSRMKKNYSFVGEKIAFGPHPLISEKSFQEIFFDFHARYFYYSKYIMIMRRPTEAIWSMQKMFPDRSMNSVIESWLKTIQIQIDVFQSFSNAYVIFFENLSTSAVLNLSSILGINIHIPKGMIREENKYSLLAEDQIPDDLSQYSEICLACEKIYKQVRDEFSPESFKYKETTANYGAARYGFSSKIQKQINEILNELSKNE